MNKITKNGEDNRRVKYTKMVLKSSLLKLMKDKPINKITVTDICKMADINRGTFYIHYFDAYDLLEKIENDLFIQISESIEKLIKNNENSKIIIKEIFEIILKNKDLCKILLSDNGDKDFLKRIINLTHNKVVTEWSMTYKNVNIHSMEYLYIYTSSGTIGIIENWIKNNFKESPERLATFVEQMTNDSLSSWLKHPL